jgi:hypothetical protein
MASAKGTKPGTILRFIVENANTASKVTEEAARLMPLLAEAGFKTTEGSVKQAISVARRIQGIPPVVRQAKQPRRKARKIQQNPRVEALGSFVDDALKGLQMLKGELRRLKDIEKKYLAIKAQFS